MYQYHFTLNMCLFFIIQGVLMTISDETKLLFSNMMELEDGIRHLISKYDKETNSPLTQQKIGQLESDLIRLASLIYKNTVTVKTYIFGSRVTGLAAENSDVDVYLQIGLFFPVLTLTI